MKGGEDKEGSDVEEGQDRQGGPEEGEEAIKDGERPAAAASNAGVQGGDEDVEMEEAQQEPGACVCGVLV